MERRSRQTWKWLCAATLGLGLASFWLGHRPAGRALAATTDDSTSFDARVHHDRQKLQLLRQTLSLTARDLAAMGCSGDQTKQILSALAGWQRQNGPPLTSAFQTESQARLAMQQQAKVGGIAIRSSGQALEIKQKLLAATSSKTQLIESAAATIASLLNADQTAIWRTARSNIAQPDVARFIPSLTHAQAKALALTWDQAGRTTHTISSNPQDSVDAVLGSAKAQTWRNASSNIQTHIEQVASAERDVLQSDSQSQSTTQPDPVSTLGN